VRPSSDSVREVGLFPGNCDEDLTVSVELKSWAEKERNLHPHWQEEPKQ
jgi:hypothetical protein